MRANNEKDNCAKCNEGVGEFPIADEVVTYWLCEKCDAELFNSMDTNFILQEIDEQIKHHCDEVPCNRTAISSLNYIRNLVERGK